jgi:HEPN domain-containing protein
MIQRIGTGDPVTKRLVDCISAVVEPWRIVLFGSRARGDFTSPSDYDVYVEVDVDAERLDGANETLCRALASCGYSYDLKVNCRRTIERRRDDPGTIEWDVAREGIVLYAHPSAALVLSPAARSVRESKTPESVFEWLESGEQNLRHCSHLRATAPGDFPSEVCWWSQQVVEKYLKALLVSRFVRLERTRDLVHLLAAGRQNGVALTGVDSDCALLKRHAIEPRYPKRSELGADEADAAYEAMGRIVAEIGRHLPARLAAAG